MTNMSYNITRAQHTSARQAGKVFLSSCIAAPLPGGACKLHIKLAGRNSSLRAGNRVMNNIASFINTSKNKGILRCLRAINFNNFVMAILIGNERVKKDKKRPDFRVLQG
jgi:hypothetical protein